MYMYVSVLQTICIDPASNYKFDQF